MIDTYKKTFACVARLWWVYLLFAALLTGMPLLLKSSGGYGGTWVGFLFFILFLHRYILFGDVALKSSGQESWGFLWVYLLIAIGVELVAQSLQFALPAGPVTLLILMQWDLLAWVPFQFLALLIHWQWYLLAWVPAMWLALSIFGTALPASAANETYGLRLTLQRCRQTAPDIAVRFLLGPGVFAAVTIGAVFFGFGLALMALGVGSSQATVSRPMLDVAGLAMNTLTQLLLMTAATMGVVILCQAYRGVQPAPSA